MPDWRVVTSSSSSSSKPDWDLFMSTPAHRVRRDPSMKKFRVPQHKLAELTALKDSGCAEPDPDRPLASVSDWLGRYGAPSPKSRFRCCLSRKTPDHRLYGGSLTLYSEQVSTPTMRNAVFARKGGGTNQFTAAAFMQSSMQG